MAEVLACMAEPLVREGKASIGKGAIRAVMYGWVAVKPLRDTGKAPAKLEASIKWLESHTIDMSEFDDPERGPDLTRRCLEAIATKLDGTRAMRNTIARRRAVVYNVLDFAVEQRVISRNPIDHIKWTTPKKAAGLAKQTVPSFQQAELLLEGVGEQGPAGRRLVAFFALMMLAALRPAEALAVRANWFVSLPDEGWGKVVLHRSTPRSGVAWSDTGRSREDRSLKHRAEGDTREVPLHPILVRIIRDHIAEHRKQGNDRLFTGPRGGLVDESVYLPLWQQARLHALGLELAATRLAWRPYDLRHFIISFWLLAGVSVTQVALWAGNSEAVIWKFYAKLMNGQEAAALDLVDRATEERAKPELEKFSSDRSANVPQLPVNPHD
jgi:integrase